MLGELLLLLLLGVEVLLSSTKPLSSAVMDCILDAEKLRSLRRSVLETIRSGERGGACFFGVEVTIDDEGSFKGAGVSLSFVIAVVG